MATVIEFQAILKNFPAVEEHPHFHRTAYKVYKKIFCTHDENAGVIVVKLNEIDQSAFCSFDHGIIRPVRGEWGKKGWTEVVLEKVQNESLFDILETAYRTVAPTKLARMINLGK